MVVLTIVAPSNGKHRLLCLSRSKNQKAFFRAQFTRSGTI